MASRIAPRPDARDDNRCAPHTANTLPRPATAAARPAAQSSLSDVARGQGQLGRGQRGVAIEALQTTLNARGAVPPLAVDGDFGARTEAAVRALQARLGLEVDGVVGPDTARALLERTPGISPTTRRVIGARPGRGAAPPLPGEAPRVPRAPRPAPPAAAEPARRAPARAPEPRTAAPRTAARPEPARAAPSTPRAPAHNAARDAAQLHEAMRGGLTGLGTDEAAIWRTLEGRTPGEVQAIRRSYRDHYRGRDLDADLRSELNDADFARARSLLRGDRSASSADALHEAMRGGVTGLGTDEAAVFRTLEGAGTPQARRGLEESYRQRHGRDLRSDLRSELSGAELTRAQALLDGNRPRAEAARLHHAMRGGVTGLGTDEAEIVQTLQRRSPQERAAIEQAYRREYGVPLSSHLRAELSGATLQRAEALRTNNDAAQRAAQVREAVVGVGTDERAVEEALRGTSRQQRTAIAAEYRRMFGTSLATDVRARSSGTDRAEAETLLARGELSDAERLHRAMNGLGTDEAGIEQVLSPRTRPEIQQIEREYQQRYGRSLQDDLRAETSGRDRFNVDMLLRGRVDVSTDAGLREAVERAEATRAFERDGLANTMGRAFVDAFSDSGRTLEANTRRTRDALADAGADGHIDDAERARVAELAGYATDDVAAFRSSRDAATEAVGVAGATVAAIGVTAVTMGAGAPVGATLVSATLAGGGTRVAVNQALQGNGATLEGTATAFATGAVDGVLVGVGGPLTGRLAKEALEHGARRTVNSAVLREADNAGARALRETGDAARVAAARQAAIEQYPARRVMRMVQADLAVTTAGQRRAAFGAASALEGTTGGALSGATTTALSDDTWRDGVARGLERVGAGAGMGAAVGGVAGGGFGAAVGGRAMRNSAQVDESRVWIDRGDGRRDFGDFDEMMHANRALQPTPRAVRLSVAGQSIEVNVFGTRSAAELQRIEASALRLAERIGPRQAQQIMREIHVRDVLGETPVDTTGTIGTIGGFAHLGRGNGEVILGRGVISTPRDVDHVLHHEVGHNFDSALGIRSARAGSLWGEGPSVSTYAGLNPAEDFAETFRFVSESWDAIRTNPEQFFSTPAGPKIRAMLTLIDAHR